MGSSSRMATERTPEEPVALNFDGSPSDRPLPPPLPSLEGDVAADTNDSTDVLHERHSISSVNNEYSSSITAPPEPDIKGAVSDDNDEVGSFDANAVLAYPAVVEVVAGPTVYVNVCTTNTRLMLRV